MTIQTNWVTRLENTQTDKLSRYTDYDDWGISQDLFLKFDLKWGPHDVDRFATHYNTQCLRFNSKIWCPGTEAIDAFGQSWQSDINWLVPPHSQAAKVVNKMVFEKAQGTLILPEWKSAPYWPLICSSKDIFKEFITDIIDYLPCNKAIVKGAGKNGIFSECPLNFRMLALKVRF